MIYLDNASTTKTDPKVIEAMTPYLTDLYGNAGTLYEFGQKSKKAIDEAREEVAQLINAKPEQIIFTSGGSEANNMVFQGIKDYLMFKNKPTIVTTQIEHDSVINAVNNLCREKYVGKDGLPFQFKAKFVPPMKNDGVSADTVINYLENKPDVGLVSVMNTNNETGILNKMCNIIGDFAYKNGILFHTDCVQALGCAKIDVDELNCDFLSMSSHKIHGVKGVGALYVRNKSIISPLICGGGAQEYGLRGGTENVVGIVGFGMACKLLRLNQEEEINYVRDLRNKLYYNIRNNLAEIGLDNVLHVNGNLDFGAPGKTINLRFDGIDAETMLLMLDSCGVCATAGSACRSHESEPSRVLTSMGISDDDARSSIRFSVSRMNTEDEIVEASKIVSDCVQFLHK